MTEVREAPVVSKVEAPRGRESVAPPTGGGIRGGSAPSRTQPPVGAADRWDAAKIDRKLKDTRDKLAQESPRKNLKLRDRGDGVMETVADWWEADEEKRLKGADAASKLAQIDTPEFRARIPDGQNVVFFFPDDGGNPEPIFVQKDVSLLHIDVESLVKDKNGVIPTGMFVQNINGKLTIPRRLVDLDFLEGKRGKRGVLRTLKNIAQSVKGVVQEIIQEGSQSSEDEQSNTEPLTVTTKGKKIGIVVSRGATPEEIRQVMRAAGIKDHESVQITDRRGKKIVLPKSVNM